MHAKALTSLIVGSLIVTRKYMPLSIKVKVVKKMKQGGGDVQGDGRLDSVPLVNRTLARVRLLQGFSLKSLSQLPSNLSVRGKGDLVLACTALRLQLKYRPIC